MMKLRKLCAVVLSGALCIALLAGCSAGTQNQKTPYDHGLELVAMLDEMSKNEEYLQVYTGSPTIGEIVAGIGEGDYSSPSNVYQITVSDESLSALGELSRIGNASENLKTFVKQRCSFVNDVRP